MREGSELDFPHAATDTIARFKELAVQREEELRKAAQICTTLKSQGQPFNPADFGFVCAAAEIEAFATRLERIANAKRPPSAPAR